MATRALLRAVPTIIGAAVCGAAMLGPAPAMASAVAPASPVTGTASVPVGATKVAPDPLGWTACPTAGSPTLQCGSLSVPYDYSNPNGPQFTLAVRKVPATGVKTGTLFFNPGGPGGAGASYVGPLWHYLPASVQEHFDLVSWDPRGIGATRPKLESCEEPRVVLPASGPVDWSAARASSEVVAAQANRSCQEHNAAFINYVGTTNVARDLDRLRAAVGDAKVTYWGLSYGTRIGYVYAMMFPDRIRAMVLDGNIDPSGTYAGLTEGGGALDSALQFMRTASAPSYQSIMATLAGLNAAPIPVGEGLRYTRWDYLTDLEWQIPNEGAWPGVLAFNHQIATARLDTPEGADARARLRASVGASDGNLGGAFSVVNCLDYADRTTPAAQNTAISAKVATAPVYGGMITTAYALGCSGLQLTPDPVPTARSAANLARIRNLPIVIANSTNDGSTPMMWALRMAKAFPRAVLIKYLGAEHGLWQLTPSDCVNSKITNYVVALQRPTPYLCRFSAPPVLPVGGLPPGDLPTFPQGLPDGGPYG